MEQNIPVRIVSAENTSTQDKFLAAATLYYLACGIDNQKYRTLEFVYEETEELSFKKFEDEKFISKFEEEI